MMLPLRYQLMSNAYKHYNRFDTAGLYRKLGWSDLARNPAWANTCAVRMSLALMACGVDVQGRIAIKNGPHKGRRVEPGQNRLSDWLIRRHGRPRTFAYDKSQPLGPAELFGRRGIVSFMRIPSYAGGHIDLLDATSNWLACSRSCYFDANEVRFWELAE